MDHAAHQQHSDPSTGPMTHEGHAAGHDRHAGHSVAMFRDKFWLSLALTMPVILLSADIQEWFGYSVPTIPGIEFVPAILGTIIFLYGGMVFIRGAQGELADRRPGMMTLISLAIIVAFVTSWAGTLGVFEVEIWWELATLITIMLLGHWLEMRSIAQAQGPSPPSPRSSPTPPSESPTTAPRRCRSAPCMSTRSSSSAPALGFPPTETSSTATPTSTSR
jgi:P-type Cu2+ transporter